MDSRFENELLCLNREFLELTVEANRAEAGEQGPFKIDRELALRLLELDSAARERLAQRSYSLLSFRLDDEEWWRFNAEDFERPTESWNCAVPRERVVALARRYLTFVWHTVTRDTVRASVSLGISPAVIEILSRLTLEQIERIAAAHPTAIGLQWSKCPLIWRRLFDAAISGSPENLELADRVAMQLLATELMRSAGATNGTRGR